GHAGGGRNVEPAVRPGAPAEPVNACRLQVDAVDESGGVAAVESEVDDRLAGCAAFAAAPGIAQDELRAACRDHDTIVGAAGGAVQRREHQHRGEAPVDHLHSFEAVAGA